MRQEEPCKLIAGPLPAFFGVGPDGPPSTSLQWTTSAIQTHATRSERGLGPAKSGFSKGVLVTQRAVAAAQRFKIMSPRFTVQSMHAKTQSASTTDKPAKAAVGKPIRSLALLLEHVLPLCTLLSVLWIVVAVEWLWTLRIAVPNPLYATAIAALMTVYVFARMRTDWLALQRYQLRTETAQELSGFLDRLRGLGFRVVHDIPGDSGNIDHAVLSTHGVFCILCRTRAKPADGDARIRYDGAAVSLNGGPYDSSVINEARIRARQLQRIVKECSGLELPVQPVLMFPGWNISAVETQNHADVWVITSKVLPMWIRNVPERIGMKDVKQAAKELSTYVGQYA